MRCSIARERMMEADTHALRGTGKSDLARHVADCAACRLAAGELLEGTLALNEALGRLGPCRLVPATLARPGGNRARAARRWGWASLPLAAAATLAALLLPGQRGDRSTGGPKPDVAPAVIAVPASIASPASVAAALEIDVPEGRRTAVFETSDPTITVVWFF